MLLWSAKQARVTLSGPDAAVFLRMEGVVAQAAERKSNRDKRFVYHLTHVTNFAQIAHGGLLSRRALAKSGAKFKDIADAQILDGRAAYDLDAMVPFHFIPQSPFDCAVVQAESDKRFILIAVARDRARAEGWRIAPKHPLADDGVPTLLEWDDGIAAIDWEQMDRYPRPYENDHHCKMVCMAEALAPSTVSPIVFDAVFAPNAETLRFVESMKSRLNPRIMLSNVPQMFPQGCRG